MAKNIFVVGLDDFNLSQLRQLRHASDYRFHALASYEEIKRSNRFPVRDILEKAQQKLQTFSGSVDAILGYWDFPVSTILPLLRQPWGLPGPTLEATLKCEHKYWSRVLQKEVIPLFVPDFAEVDPFEPGAADAIELEYPYWLKPVKSASSYLGFRIHNRDELQQSLAIIRDKIGRFAHPFNVILGYANLPADIAHVDGNHCIAENIISNGEQCTLEGYVYDNDVNVYGVVDSLRGGRHKSCFTRYQYPSSLPMTVQQRMIEATVKLLQHLEYNNGPFNVEYYWNPRNDNIWLLEINARISKSHCPLFKMVDGEYHHAVMIALALGEAPDFPHREGHYKMAAKFMLRRYRDGVVKRVPGREDIDKVKARFPDTAVLLHVKPGQRLSHLPDQDSYSYEIAVIFMGGDSERHLVNNYHAALKMLPFVIDEQDSDPNKMMTTNKEQA